MTMYRSPRLVEVPRELPLPSGMYKMRTFNDTGGLDLAADYYNQARVPQARNDVLTLEVRQEAVLDRLRNLKLQLDRLQSSRVASRANAAATTPVLGAAAHSSPVKSVASVHDVVVSASPSAPPYSLVLLRRLLGKAGCPVHASSRLHSSVSQVSDHLQRAFTACPLGERGKHPLAISLQWTETPISTLMVSPLRQTRISGEANIVRYVSRLFPLVSPYNYEASGTFAAITETDQLLDNLDKQLARGTSREHQAAMRWLNGRLGKTAFLGGASCGVADILAWSLLRQVPELTEAAPDNVCKWLSVMDSMVDVDLGVTGSPKTGRQKQQERSNTGKPIGVPVLQKGNKKTNQNQQPRAPSKNQQPRAHSKNQQPTAPSQNQQPTAPSQNQQPTTPRQNQQTTAPNKGPSTHMTREQLEAYLKNLNIPYQVKEHAEVFTVEALMEQVKDMEGVIMKNLFLRDKKKNLYLLSTKHDTEVELKKLASQIGAKDLRFADESVVQEVLGVRQGCVTALALANDTAAHRVTFLLEQSVLSPAHSYVNFHPLVNDATLGVSPCNLERFLEATGHKPKMVTFN